MQRLDSRSDWSTAMDFRLFLRAALSLVLPIGVIAGIVFINRSNVNESTVDLSPTSPFVQYPDVSANQEWAKKVVEGGYILHFRHAQREKWTDVTTFDAIELLNGLDASQESFSRATCLTPRGVEEAKLIGAVFDSLDISIAAVHSSPSCRARQTSIFAFGEVGTISNSLLHRTAISKSQHSAFASNLRTLITDIEIPDNSNVILSGHGGTLGYDGASVIDDYRANVNIDDREEGGFAVLENSDGKIIVHHVFLNFSQFANEAIMLPVSMNTSNVSLSSSATVNKL